MPISAFLTVRDPRGLARVAGGLYLYIVAAGIFAEAIVRGSIIVTGDPAATAAKLLAAEGLFRLGYVAEVGLVAADVAVAVLLYILLRPVSRTLALLAAAFRLTTAAIAGANATNHIEALNLLTGADYLQVFGRAHAESLAFLALKDHALTYGVSLVFFGVFCLLVGVLIIRSSFLPKALGWLMAIAGACYLVNSLAPYLAPELSGGLFPWILLPCLIAELGLSLWLLVVGVDPDRWVSQSAAGDE